MLNKLWPEIFIVQQEKAAIITLKICNGAVIASHCSPCSSNLIKLRKSLGKFILNCPPIYTIITTYLSSQWKPLHKIRNILPADYLLLLKKKNRLHFFHKQPRFLAPESVSYHYLSLQHHQTTTWGSRLQDYGKHHHCQWLTGLEGKGRRWKSVW